MKYAFKPWSFLIDRSPFVRLVIGTVFALAFGLVYVWFFQFSGMVWKDPATATTMTLLTFMWVLNFMYLFGLSTDNWPFSLWVPQPLQGLLIAICSVILGFCAFLIFDKLGLHAHVFALGVWTMLFIFLFPAWTGPGFIREAYGGKQPITGISTGITALGLAVLCWWFTVAVTTKDFVPSIAAVPIGMPFVWFCAAVTFAFAMRMWPFQVKQPQQLVMFIGYMSTYSIFYLWLMNALGLDWFIGPPMHGAVYTLLWLLPSLFWIAFGQAWPFHTARPWVLCLWVVLVPMVVCWFLFNNIVIPLTSTGTAANWTDGKHVMNMMYAMNLELGAFTGWAATYFCMGWMFLPPPK